MPGVSEMTIRESRSQRRSWVIVNYCSLFLLLIFWNALPRLEVDDLFRLLSLVLFISMVAISFVIVQVRTGLWKLVHSRPDSMDERELQNVFVALRYAYGIFAVICLAVLFAQVLFLDFTDLVFIDVLLASSLLYFAHSLPASILAWTMREV